MPAAEPAGFLLGAGPRPLPVHPGDVLTFGRDAQNSVVVEDAMASRRHAALECTSTGKVIVKDLGSSNGTYMSDERLAKEEPRILNNGDQFRIGGRIYSYVSKNAASEPRQLAAKSTQRLTQMETLVPGALNVAEVLKKGPPAGATTVQVLPKPAPAGRSALSGNLRDQSFIQILQFLHTNRKTGELHVHTNQAVLKCALEQGNLFFAQSETKEGFDAVFACSGSAEGYFQFVPTDSAPAHSKNITDPTMTVIFECCRNLDESGRQAT